MVGHAHGEFDAVFEPFAVEPIDSIARSETGPRGRRARDYVR